MFFRGFSERGKSIVSHFFWNVMFWHRKLFSNAKSAWHSPFILGELDKKILSFPSLTIWAFISPPLIRKLSLGSATQGKIAHYRRWLYPFYHWRCWESSRRGLLCKGCHIFLTWIFSLLLRDFEARRLRSIFITSLATLTEFFYIDTVSNVHPSLESWYFTSSSI